MGGQRIQRHTPGRATPAPQAARRSARLPLHNGQYRDAASLFFSRRSFSQSPYGYVRATEEPMTAAGVYCTRRAIARAIDLRGWSGRGRIRGIGPAWP